MIPIAHCQNQAANSLVTQEARISAATCIDLRYLEYHPGLRARRIDYVDGLVQERRNSSVLAMELRLS